MIWVKLCLFIDQQKVISDEIKHKYQQINKSSNLKENWQVVWYFQLCEVYSPTLIILSILL